VKPDESSLVWDGLNILLGGINDEQTKDISRIFYEPSCPAEFKKDAWFYENHGEWIDPDYLISIAHHHKKINH